MRAAQQAPDDTRRTTTQRGLNLYETAVAAAGASTLIGTPRELARTMTDMVQAGGWDGSMLTPDLLLHGLDELIDRVVPELQQLGSFRSEYAGTTLRSHLGLGDPVRG